MTDFPPCLPTHLLLPSLRLQVRCKSSAWHNFRIQSFHTKWHLGLTGASSKVIGLHGPFLIKNSSLPLDAFKILSGTMVSLRPSGFRCQWRRETGASGAFSHGGQQQQERTSGNTSVQVTSDFVLRLVPSHSAISVGGIDLNKDSLIGSLRAGCDVCGVSAAGSKQKLHQRLLQHCDELHMGFEAHLSDTFEEVWALIISRHTKYTFFLFRAKIAKTHPDWSSNKFRTINLSSRFDNTTKPTQLWTVTPCEKKINKFRTDALVSSNQMFWVSPVGLWSALNKPNSHHAAYWRWLISCRARSSPLGSQWRGWVEHRHLCFRILGLKPCYILSLAEAPSVCASCSPKIWFGFFDWIVSRCWPWK